MTSPQRAETLVLTWARTYTRGLHDQTRQRRLDELASDCHEQRRWGDEVGASPVAVATSMVARTLAGMPADLLWRQGQLATSRDRSLNPRGRPMGRWIKDNWWLALGALLGALEVILGVGMAVTDESTGSVTAGVIIALLGMAILAGIAVRRRRRRGGDLLMIAGTLPAYPFVWTIVLPVLGVLVATPAMLDAADATAVGPAAPAPQRTSGSDTATSVLLGALVVAVAVSSLIREQETTVSLLSPAFGVLGAHLLLRRRIGGPILARVGMTAFVASLLTGALLMLWIIVTGIDDGESPITGLPAVVGRTVLAAGPVGLVAFVVGTRRSRDRARPA